LARPNATGPGIPDGHDASGVGVRERLEQNRVSRAE
jgi:hypothetical protein